MTAAGASVDLYPSPSRDLVRGPGGPPWPVRRCSRSAWVARAAATAGGPRLPRLTGGTRSQVKREGSAVVVGMAVPTCAGL